MSLPYIPGWWDSIGQGVTGVVKQLPQVMQPDRIAQKRLQEMVQQNPEILEQFSNMDETTRNAFVQSLGFKNQNPLSNVAVGSKRKLREEEEGVIASATPEQLAERRGKIGGFSTTAEIARRKIEEDRKDAVFKMTQELSELNKSILGSKITETARQEKMIAAAQAKYPELSKVDLTGAVRNMMYKGIAPDPMLMDAVTNSPGAALIVESLMKVEMEKMQQAARVRLQTMKDPNENAIFLRGLSEYGRQLNAETQRLQTDIKLAMENSMLDGTAKARIPIMQEQLKNLQQKAYENSMITGELNKKLAGEAGVNIPLSAKALAAVERIKSGKNTLQDLESTVTFSLEEKTAIKAALGAK